MGININADKLLEPYLNYQGSSPYDVEGTFNYTGFEAPKTRQLIALYNNEDDYGGSSEAENKRLWQEKMRQAGYELNRPGDAAYGMANARWGSEEYNQAYQKWMTEKEDARAQFDAIQASKSKKTYAQYLNNLYGGEGSVNSMMDQSLADLDYSMQGHGGTYDQIRQQLNQMGLRGSGGAAEMLGQAGADYARARSGVVQGYQNQANQAIGQFLGGQMDWNQQNQLSSLQQALEMQNQNLQYSFNTAMANKQWQQALKIQREMLKSQESQSLTKGVFDIIGKFIKPSIGF